MGGNHERSNDQQPGAETDFPEGTPVLAAKVLPPEPSPVLRRPRLEERLRAAFAHRMVLVVAPAGAGKTTLLRELTDLVDVPSAWYRADAGDRTETLLLRHLRESVGRATHAMPRAWTSAREMIRDLEQVGPLLLVIDDLHALQGSSALQAIEEAVEYLPPDVTIAAASRTVPDINLSRLRVSGELLDMGADELRFRTWEIEALYRDVYDRQLPPEESASLARRTQGWAAGLQLYHLATRDKAPEIRERTLEALRSGGRLTGEYLATNVIAGLPRDLRDFLLETCVLGTMTPEICDELRGRDDSAGFLETLHRTQVFTALVDDAPTYRYHTVLRTHLEATLAGRAEHDELEERYLHAGKLLERASLLPDAVRAYAHAEAWDAAAGLVRRGGSQLANVRRSNDWLDALPESFVEDDPWLLLAVARKRVALGELGEALAAYRQAEERLRPLGAADECARERRALDVWLHAAPVLSGSRWHDRLRRGTRSSPGELVEDPGPPPGPRQAVVQAALALLAGDARSVRRWTRPVEDRGDVGPLLTTANRILGILGGILAGEKPPAVELTAIGDELDRLGMVWPSRIVRSLVSLAEADTLSWVRYLRAEQQAKDNGWGTGITGLVEGTAALVHGRPDPEPLVAAAAAFEELDAPVLEAWVRALLALARIRMDDADAEAALSSAERLARRVDVPGALAVCAVAGGLLGGDSETGRSYRELADVLGGRLGIDVAALKRIGTPVSERGGGADPVRGVSRPGPAVRLRCFGRFEMQVGSRPIEIDALQPQLRRGLFLFAVNLGSPLHRERIAEIFWPAVGRDSAIHNVQTLVSSLRRTLAPGSEHVAGVDVVRVGDAYELQLGPDAEADVVGFERAHRQALDARLDREPEQEVRALRRMLDLYRGELLPEAGPGDWCEHPRERFRIRAAEAGARLAQELVRQRRLTTAIEVCERGLEIDRFNDRIWQLLINAHEMNGDPASATVARRRYTTVLGELGIDPEAVLADAACCEAVRRRVAQTSRSQIRDGP